MRFRWIGCSTCTVVPQEMVQTVVLLGKFWDIYDPWVHLPNECCGICGYKTDRDSTYTDQCLGIQVAARTLRPLAARSCGNTDNYRRKKHLTTTRPARASFLLLKGASAACLPACPSARPPAALLPAALLPVCCYARPKRPHDGPRWSKDGPTLAPIWPQDSPRWLQDGP